MRKKLKKAFRLASLVAILFLLYGSLIMPLLALLQTSRSIRVVATIDDLTKYIYGFGGNYVDMCTQNLQRAKEIGIRVWRVGLLWHFYEPRENEFNQTYIAGFRNYLSAIRQADLKIVLWISFHWYVPDWVYAIPNSRVVNQYGDEYVGNPETGRDFANWIWNPAIRAILANTLKHILEDFGTDFWAVSPAIGRWGEIQYPPPEYNGHTNSYWAFDELAQADCPVPSWKPGDPSPNDEARIFIDWYVDSYIGALNWIINEVRKYYSGTITFGMSGWGFCRWFDEVISTNLNGTSISEQWGQVSKGYNWERIVSGIEDPNFMPWQTGVDCPWSIYSGVPANDTSENPRMWSMAKWLAHLAHRNGFKVMCEPSGDVETQEDTMQKSFENMHKNGYIGILWFNEDYFFNENHVDILKKYMDMYRR